MGRYSGLTIMGVLIILAFLVVEAGTTDAGDIQALAHIATANPSFNESGTWVGDPCDAQWFGVTCTGPRVTTFNFTSTTLSGHIPPEIAGLLSLEKLFLREANLTGELPPELGHLSKLTELSLDRNQLTGPIPPELGNLTNLIILELQDNKLSGPIPKELGGIHFLAGINFARNQLSGSIPPEFGNLTFLRWLTLDNNQLSGPIPREIGNAPIEILHLSFNKLNGSIPPDIGSSIQVLEIGSNQLTGIIPSEFGNILNLAFLTLDNNRLTGPIPPELGTLEVLGTMPAWSTGDVPARNRVNLALNFLNGSVPEFARKMNMSIALNCFELSDNPTHYYELGQRDAGACAAVYPNVLSCNCAAPRVLGINGSCYCVTPLRFEALFTSADTQRLSTFTNNLDLTMGQIAAALKVAAEQATAVNVTKETYRTVVLTMNVLPPGDMTEVPGNESARILALIDNVTFDSINNQPLPLFSETVQVPGFDAGVAKLTFYNQAVLPLPPAPAPISSRNPPSPAAKPSMPPAHVPTPSPSQTTASGQKSMLAAGLSVGAVLLLMAAVLACWICWKCRRGKPSDSVIIEGTMVKRWELAELKAATKNFHESCMIGVGAFSTVYKAEVDNVLMAVKRLNDRGKATQDEKELVSEVQTVGDISNRYLVRLRGYCMEDGESLLVYDYMENGSLEDCLFGEKGPLPWPKCVSILAGTANAIAYLHEGCKQKIIHRDIKAANILLDKDFTPHVADFGLVRSTLLADTHVSTRVAGTVGYLAPEYAQSGQLTEKSDVYSFGVVMLVVMGHRHAFEALAADGCVSIVQKAFQALEGGDLLRLMAPHLSGQYEEEQAKRLLSIAFLCIQPEWQNRPTMGHVVQMLNGNMDIPSLKLNATVPQLLILPGFTKWSNAGSSVGTGTSSSHASSHM